MKNNKLILKEKVTWGLLTETHPIMDSVCKQFSLFGLLPKDSLKRF